MSSINPKIGPEPADGKAKCAEDCGSNDLRTELLRRAVQSSLDYGSETFVSRISGVCMSSTYKQLSGAQRLSASVLRASLVLLPREQASALLDAWLGGGR